MFRSALLGGKPTASLNQYTQNTEPKTRSERVDFLRNISAVIGDYPFVCATTEFGTEYANLRHNGNISNINQYGMHTSGQ